jgi:rRNA biogenesis protein RRP5
VVRADRGKLKLSLAPGGVVAAGMRGGGEADGGGGGIGGGERADVGAPPPGTVIEEALVRRVDETTGNVQVTLPGGVPGVVTAAQMSDHPMTGAALSSMYRAGDVIGPLVALEAKPRRSVLSRKLSLVAAAREGNLPGDVSAVVVGAVYPGYVASCTQNAGVFVRFLGRLTGLAPPSTLTDAANGAGGIDVEEMFALGQTVLARVVAVDAAASPPRLSLSLAPRAAAASSPTADAPLIAALFTDVDAADALADARDADADAAGDDSEHGAGVVLSAAAALALAPGADVVGTVHGVREYGVLVNMPDVDPDAVGLITFHQLPLTAEAAAAEVTEENAAEVAGVHDGAAVVGRVLDVSRREGVVDIGARAALTGTSAVAASTTPSKKAAPKAAVAAAKKRRAAATAASQLPVGTKVTAEVELVKPDYAVLSLPDHGGAVGYAPVHHLNLRYADAAERFQPLQRVAAVVAGNAASGSPGGRLLLTVPLLGGVGGGGGRSDGSGATAGAEQERAGTTLEGVVHEVQPMQMILTLPGGRRGRLHATEATGGGGADAGGFPLRNVAVGAVIAVVVIGSAGERGSMLELTARRTPKEARAIAAAATDAGGADGGGTGIAGVAALATLDEGDVVDGVVTAVSSDTLAVSIAPGLTARVPRIETADTAAALRKSLTSRFAVGQRVAAYVLSADAARRRMLVTLRTPAGRQVVAGAKIAGTVSKVAPGGGGVFVQLNSRQHGRVHVTDIADDPRPELWKDYKPGDVVEVRVLYMATPEPHTTNPINPMNPIHLNLKP